ncbi:hypothetical protein BDN70DRAFT_928879 [Pholiota conissans]|uniref:Uncharacterized protein n=1 Tax=Pholiota conissans TaxID=109636 RepID=A0A9P6D5R2_9AGAR|nr:hypothetical protein BDN70DRAFT_928879 [Pholiota conissans]
MGFWQISMCWSRRQTPVQQHFITSFRCLWSPPPHLRRRPSRVVFPMSTSPPDAHDENDKDELADPNHAADDAEAGASTTPAKRGRGRPKGSKNKKGASATVASPESPTAPTRKRGRPPKEKKEDAGEEPAPKRPRGRPPKVKPAPAPEEATTSAAADAGETSTKKKRGRPPKKPAA